MLWLTNASMWFLQCTFRALTAHFRNYLAGLKLKIASSVRFHFFLGNKPLIGPNLLLLLHPFACLFVYESTAVCCVLMKHKIFTFFIYISSRWSLSDSDVGLECVLDRLWMCVYIHLFAQCYPACVRPTGVTQLSTVELYKNPSSTKREQTTAVCSGFPNKHFTRRAVDGGERRKAKK